MSNITALYVAIVARGIDSDRILARCGVNHLFYPYDNAADFAAQDIIAALRPNPGAAIAR